VLFDRPGKLEGQMIGKSPHMQSVYAQDAASFAGRIVDVTITGAYQNSVSGVIGELKDLSFPRRRES